MDPEDLVVEAFGVLLTQVRTARRALEDIERNTSRYLGFEFAKALAEGPEFGSPPMFNGALMVHVVNINDLAPGNSFGGFLEALFGGIGNFFSNLIGGLVGGFLTSFSLPWMVRSLERIVENIRQIIERLGVRGGGESAPETPSSSSEAHATSGETILTTLEGIRGTIRDVTALFEAASSGPEAADEGATSERPFSRTGERLMAILDGVNRALDRTAHIVDGLILLIPNVIGALALLIANLAGIRRAILETVQFILRNALVLRGVLLTVIFETVASAARLAASVVGILGTAIQSVLTSIGAAVQTIVGAVFDALEAITTALQEIIGSLIGWLVSGVFTALRALGELQVFRTIDHLVRILPSLIPPIYMLLNEGAALPTDVMNMLRESHRAAFPTGGGAAGSGGTGAGAGPTTLTIEPPPALGEYLDPLRDTITSSLETLTTSLGDTSRDVFGTAETALSGLAGRFDRAVSHEADFSRGILDRHVDRIRGEASTLANAIREPLAAESPETGLEAIANAYQDWLVGGGMNAIFDQISHHFTTRPTEGEPGGALRLLRGQFDRPSATIDIDLVEIQITGGEERERAAPPTSRLDPPRCMTDEEVYQAVVRYSLEREERAIRPPDPYTAIA